MKNINYCCKVTKEQVQVFIEIAKNMKYRICNAVPHECGVGETYEYIAFNPKDSIEVWAVKKVHEDYVEVDVKNMVSLMLGNSVLISVELNNEYTAEVDIIKQVVIVGCQTIPASKVIEIANILKMN